MWSRREIENYLCNRTAIMEYICNGLENDLIGAAQNEERQEKMELEIKKLEAAIQTLGNPAPFSKDIKASDDFLIPLFRNFLESPDTGAITRPAFLPGKKGFLQIGCVYSAG